MRSGHPVTSTVVVIVATAAMIRLEAIRISPVANLQRTVFDSKLLGLKLTWGPPGMAFGLQKSETQGERIFPKAPDSKPWLLCRVLGDSHVRPCTSWGKCPHFVG